MNTVKKRLENRTNAVIAALNSLAELNEKGAHYSDLDVDKIEKAITQVLNETANILRNRPDKIDFKLDTAKRIF